MLSRIRHHVDSGRKLGEYFSSDIFKAGFQRVFEPFPRSKGFQSVSKGFPKCFERVSKEFQSVSKGFPKGFQRVSKGFPKGVRATSNPLENAFVDKTCFRISAVRYVQKIAPVGLSCRNCFFRCFALILG